MKNVKVEDLGVVKTEETIKEFKNSFQIVTVLNVNCSDEQFEKYLKNKKIKIIK